MTKHTVTDVIDGDTIDVTPQWRFSGRSGNRVRLARVNAPELNQPGGQAAKRKLINQVASRTVDLRNAVNFSYGRLVCDVYVGGRKVPY